MAASRSSGPRRSPILFGRSGWSFAFVFCLYAYQGLVAGFALTAEASLSLLGFGVQAPQASWGSMLGQGYNFIYQQPWLVVFPGCAIALAVLAFNVFGDGLRDAIGRRK